jgi:hypothetical protein
MRDVNVVSFLIHFSCDNKNIGVFLALSSHDAPLYLSSIPGMGGFFRFSVRNAQIVRSWPCGCARAPPRGSASFSWVLGCSCLLFLASLRRRNVPTDVSRAGWQQGRLGEKSAQLLRAETPRHVIVIRRALRTRAQLAELLREVRGRVLTAMEALAAGGSRGARRGAVEARRGAVEAESGSHRRRREINLRPVSLKGQLWMRK